MGWSGLQSFFFMFKATWHFTQQYSKSSLKNFDQQDPYCKTLNDLILDSLCPPQNKNDKISDIPLFLFNYTTSINMIYTPME